jgi:lysophospholipase L1-like esterase
MTWVRHTRAVLELGVIVACAIVLARDTPATYVVSPATPADAVDAARQKTLALRKADHILFLGDSLTHRGQGSAGYVSRVRSALAQKFPELELEVEAVAADGDNVLDLLERLNRDVLPRNPSIVVIQIGCNDARRLPRHKFKAGLEELIDRLQEARIQVVQSTLTSVGERHDGTNDWDPQLDDYARIAREVAVARGVPIVDLRLAFQNYWKQNNLRNEAKDVLTYDGNHFNDEGNRFVSELMMGKFRGPRAAP